MAKNVLVLGAQGFVGGFLLPALKKSGHQVFSPEIEIRNFDQVKETLASISNLHAVVLLAGISSPSDARKDQTKLYQVNVGGVINVTKALIDTYPKAHLIFASSAQVYAVNKSENILSESSELNPQNEYALSKLLAEDVIRRFCDLHANFSSSIMRVFNHTHLSQPGNLFVPSIVRQINEAKASGTKNAILTVGNIEITRDFSPVYNLVAAIESLILHSENTNGCEIYNVCSGKGIKLKDLILAIAKNFQLEVTLTVDRGLLRPGEPELIVGNNQKILAMQKQYNIPIKNEIELIYA